MKNLFKKSLLVLIGVLITSLTTQMWAKTVYFKNTSSWGTVLIHYWGGSSGSDWPGTSMSQIGTTDYYKKDVGNNTQCLFQKAADEGKTADQSVQDGKVCYYNNNSPYWNYASRTGLTVYFDIRNVTDWATPHLRVGRGDHNLAYSMSLVSGTKYLYSVSSPGYDNYSAFTVADNDGWQNSNTIYQPSDTKPTGEHAITKLLNYQNYNILENNVYLLASSKNKTADDADYWNVTTQNALPTYTVSYSKSGTGTGTLSVTKYNGSTYDAFSSGGSVNPTQIMKIVATPNDGNALTSFSVSGATRIGETDTYYVTGTTTISATFTPEETHNVTVYYKCGAMTIANSTTESGVGVTTTRSVSAPAINDHTFSSWTAGTGVKTNSSTSATPISINSKVSGTYSLTANYTLVPCKLYKLSAAKNGTTTDQGAMSYDPDVDAYYIEITTDAKPFYFRFYHNTTNQFCSTWEDDYAGGYTTGKQVTANGDKVECAQKVVNGEGGDSWKDKPAMYFDGLSGSTIKIWFDYQNKKTWITETKYTVSTANDGHGTASPASVQAGKNTLSGDITAYAATGYTFNNWTVTSGGANITLTSATANPTTVKATSAGTIQANFKHRYVLRGSKNGEDATHGGMAGWSADDNSSYSTATISDGVMTITANLTLAKTKYKMKIRDIEGSGAYYSKNSQDWTSNSNATLNTSDVSDITFTTTAPGTYTFTFNCSSMNLALAYPSVYTVTYGYGTGGSSVTATVGGNSIGASPGYAQAGSNVVLSYTKLDGYDFKEWNTQQDGKGTKLGTDDTYTISSIGANKTVYAIFTPQTYTNVTLDKNGGSTDGKYSVTYKETSISVTTTPAKTGYHVDGYYKQAGLTNLIATSAGALQVSTDYTNGSSQWTQTSGQTLYTKWAANTYTAANNIDGDGGSNGQYTATYDATSISINTAPTRTGYNLTGFHAYGCGANTLANSSGTLKASQSEDRDEDARTLTNSDKQWIYDGTDAVIYADWTPITYTIRFNGNGNTGGSMSDQTSIAYNSATTITANAFTKTGYSFAGWATTADGSVVRADGAAHGNLTSTDGATVDLFAKWTANNYTVTLSCEEETGYGSSPSGVKGSVSATYDAAMPSMGTAPVGAAGYKFDGYWSGTGGTGTQYYAADGSSVTNWNVDENTTLHAYFKKTVISSLEHPAAVAKGHEVTVDVNPVFNQTGATNYMDICWSLLYDNDNPVESGVVVASNPADGKPNQVRFTLTELSSGYYKIKAVLKANASSFDACSTGTELSTIKSDLRIAGNSTVTIQYEDASGNKIAANTSVEVARGDSIGIKAPNIIGYSFTGWTLGDVLHNTCRDGGSCGTGKDSINIKADYDGYLTASYAKKQMIYFNNTLGWDTVYVYFYNNSNYWGGGNQGTGARTGDYGSSYTGKHGGMTRIAGTNIYYFDLAANSVSTSLTNIAFTEIDQNGELYFYANNVIGRGDYSGTLSMYVPLAGVDPVTKNGDGEYKSYYYEKGYWMNYPESTGYTLKIYDNTGAGALVKERNFEFPDNKAMPMSVTVDLEGGNKTYGFKIYRAGGTWFRNGGTMTNGHSGDEGQAAWVFGTDDGTNCGLTTTSAGNYTFKVWVNSDGNHQVGVHYPESTGDFRVMYIDDVRIANHDSNEGKSWLLSSVIPGNTASDTISYFVRAEGGKNPKYKIQKCTVSEEAREEDRTVGWADQGDAIEVPDSITENGVYNFIFKKDNSNNLVLEKIELYEGNFYIRVDGAGSSNWDNFRASDHLMPYSDYSFSQATDPYSHYFTQWYKVVKEGGDVKVKNIKFVVANDYSVCVSDTIVKDGKADAYVDANGYITRSANIRFMYNYKTNEATRRYVDGAQESGSEFLMILSDDSKMFAASSGGSALTELRFSDKGNWIYEAEVYALPTATYKLKSKFGANATGDATKDWERKGEITQYFKGSESTTETLIGGDEKSETRVKIRLLYDFKTNRVVAAYQPSSGTIASEMAINADIMFMREHQGDIEQITFSGDAKIKDIKNIYCSLKFNKYTLNNKSTEVGHATLSPLLSRYERDIFYVSFPYDVRVSDVIGFGTYGQHWIIEYYNGAERAEKGFWQDSESYWHFVTPAMKDTFTLKAGTGYIVALDLDEMYWIDNTHHSSVWNNTDEVELLFPGDVSTISNETVKYTMPSHQCTINRGDGTQGDRRVKDSHWNVLGVPTFKNITGAASGDSDQGVGSGDLVFSNVAWIRDTMNLKFIYDGNLSDNSLTAKKTAGFEFKAMHAYVVQYCGDVTFTTSATPAPSSIVARRTYAEKPRDIDFRLELNKNGVMEDQTFVSLSNDENVSAGFAFGEDLSKEFNTKRANIYTFIGSEWVAGNTLPMSEQTTVIPVGVKIAADGDYTFAIPEGTEGIGVTLIDNETGIRTSLSALDYTINLSAGTYDERFVLEISPIKPISTGVEEVTDDGLQVTGARKVMIDGLLYIVKDGKMFDAQGRQVK